MDSTSRQANTRDHNRHIGHVQSHYEGCHNQDNDKSPASHKAGKTRTVSVSQPLSRIIFQSLSGYFWRQKLFNECKRPLDRDTLEVSLLIKVANNCSYFTFGIV